MASKKLLLILALTSSFSVISSSFFEPSIDVECTKKKLKARNGCFLKKIEILTSDQKFKVKNYERDMRALSIDHKRVHYLPENFLKQIDDFTVLHVVHCELKSVNKSGFDIMNKLEDINLEGNEITELDIDLFRSLLKLNVLNLANNKITTIQRALFDDNVALETLILSYNHITRIHEYTFMKLSNFKNLFLSNNLIRELRGDTFTANVVLTMVDFSNNSLEFIGSNIFDSSKGKLITVNLENNICIEKNDAFFNQSTKALNFDALRNEIIEKCLPLPIKECNAEKSTLEMEKEEMNSTISKMQVEKKELESSIEDYQKRLSEKDVELLSYKKTIKDMEVKANQTNVELQNLDLVRELKNRCMDKENYFTKSYETCEAQLANKTTLMNYALDQLNVCEKTSRHTKLETNEGEGFDKGGENVAKCNQFEIICDSSLNDLTCEARGVVTPYESMTLANSSASRELKTLVISDSFMKFLPANILESYPKMTLFEVTNSNIRFLGERTFATAGNLDILKITKNSISELKDNVFEGAKKLRSLQLDSNGIKTVSAKAFNDLNNLALLSLKNNDIAELPATIFANLIELKALYLANNKIERLSAVVLSNNRKIESITINKNPLKTIGNQLLENCVNLKEIYYGKSMCIIELKKTTSREEFKREVTQKCSV